MKKIAIAAAAAGGTALIAFGASGTFAALNDTEGFSGRAGAATLDLTAGAAATPTDAVALNMAPGDNNTVYFPYFVQNVGDLNGFLGATINLTDAENSCSGNEWDVDKDCGQANGKGEFSKSARYAVSYTEGGSATDCKAQPGAVPVINDFAIPAGAPTSVSVPAVVPVAKDYSICVVVGVSLPKTAGNEVQGDSAELAVELRLEQFKQTNV
ncbi:hypothetical protein ACI79C_23985 [Geodermatophilus sp. SYSU D00697]